MQPSFKSINSNISSSAVTLDNYCSDTNHTNYLIDWNSTFSLNNYLIKYDLLCNETKSEIMLLGLCLKIGFFLYLIFVSHTIDTLGRLRAFTIGMILYILSLTAVVACPQTPHYHHGVYNTDESNAYLYILYVAVICHGVAYHLLYYAGWIYFLELLSS